MRRGGGARGGAVLYRPVRPCAGVAVSTCPFGEARWRAAVCLCAPYCSGGCVAVGVKPTGNCSGVLACVGVR